MVDINKAESTSTLAVPNTSEIGQARIITSSRFIEDLRRQELRFLPTRLKTYDCMIEDDAVFNSIDVTNLFVINALSPGSFVPTKSNSSRIAADFLNYNIRNMTFGTWLEFLTNAVSDLQYGFSLFNIVLERRTHGEFKGSLVLKKLSPRDQKSVHGWLWDKNFRELKGFVQKPSLARLRGRSLPFFGGINELVTGRFFKNEYPVIKTHQMLHFKHNAKNNNPQGDSPLAHCYQAYCEKKLVEKYEVVGVSKDLGGALILRVPSELIERAQRPDQYPLEAEEYKQLQLDAGKLHSGENSYIVLTSEVDSVSGEPLYDIKFQGIEGGGKQYNTSDIINQKRKSIYNTFGTGFLLLGQESVGSYSLSTSATSTHGYYVERIINQKIDVLNNQLAPRLLAANNIFLSYKDMPEFKAKDPQNFDLDVMSKFVQRLGSVNKLTEEALTYFYDKAGLPLEGIGDLNFDDSGDSRAGESKGTSGTGSTQSGGASSEVNSENATKNLIIDYEDESQITVIDTTTDKTFVIDK